MTTTIQALDAQRCPLCNTEGRFLYKVTDLNQKRTDEQFDFNKCEGCNYGWISPQPSPEKLITYYGHDETGLSIQAVEAGKVYDSERRIERLKRLRPGGSVLDIGCGVGHFLNIARKAGYQVGGLEFDDRRAAWVRENRHIDVTCGVFPGAEFKNAPYDIITMWHVIEHLTDPFAAIEAVLGLLKPGGVFSLATPNLNSVQSRMFGPRWFHQDAPRHLFLFSDQGLQRMLEKTGFRHVQTVWHSPEHDWAGIQYSIELHYMKNAQPGGSRPSQRVLQWLSPHLARVEAQFQRGATFEMDCVKP